MTDTLKIQKGKQAEKRACDFLCQKGLKIMTQNYRCFSGEIDLIMRDGDDIVFIEVRSRNHAHYGSALESVNKTKQKKIFRTALHFLQRKNWLHKINCRFDVISIDQNNLEWIKNAFTVDTF